jgi:hypothetical protein
MEGKQEMTLVSSTDFDDINVRKMNEIFQKPATA